MKETHHTKRVDPLSMPIADDPTAPAASSAPPPRDWGATSEDYARFRPNYPESFFNRLKALGIGLPGQRILDLGTGVGFLARRFAEAGCTVTAIDIAENQIRVAKREAARSGLDIDFRLMPAEGLDPLEGPYDIITASQCWGYFDAEKALPHIKRLLAPDGIFLGAFIVWIPAPGSLMKTVEDLILKHNPGWSGAGYAGEVPVHEHWPDDDFTLSSFFWYDEPISFTRERLRGRMRACRGVGVEMPPDTAERFHHELAALLDDLAPDEFTITHRICAYAYRKHPHDAGPQQT